MPQAKKNDIPDVVVPDFAVVTGEGEQVVIDRINRAVDLLRQQRELQGQISKNRETLRVFDGDEMLTVAQGEWLDAFYPQKEKGSRRSAEEIAKTRKVRAAALGVSESDVGDDSTDE